MAKYDEIMQRIENILRKKSEGSFEDALPVLCEYLQKNLQFPFEVKGIEDFQWEEPYVIGGWDPNEYKQLKKNNLRIAIGVTYYPLMLTLTPNG